MKTIKDHFNNLRDFDLMLASAFKNARGSSANDFLDGVEARRKKYGETCALSDAQCKWLCDIAAGS